MATKQNSTSILGDINPPKAIIKLALPATLALLAKAVYNIVDTAYIGMLDSDIALTAVGVTVPLLLIMVSIETSSPPEPLYWRGGIWGLRTRRVPAALSPPSSACPSSSAWCCAWAALHLSSR